MHKTVASKLRRELETGLCRKSGRELTEEQREQKRRRLETGGLHVETRRAITGAARRVVVAVQQVGNEVKQCVQQHVQPIADALGLGAGATSAQLYRQAAILREQARARRGEEKEAKDKETAAHRQKEGQKRRRPTRQRPAQTPSAAAEAAAAPAAGM